MNDVEYIFRKDIQDKKSTGRGIYSKKNGAKSKKCTFPSDNLTKREKERMNGEVMTYDLKKFYSWEAFKAMPTRIQEEYLNRVIDTYHVTLTDIAKEQFSRSKTALRSHAIRYQYYHRLHLAGHGQCATKENLERYLTDLAMESESVVKPDIEPTLSDSVSKNVEVALPEALPEPVCAPEPVNEISVPQHGVIIDEDIPSPMEEPISGAMTSIDTKMPLKKSRHTVVHPVSIEELAVATPNIQSVSIVMDGFDVDLFRYLSTKYSRDKKIRISLVVEECV